MCVIYLKEVIFQKELTYPDLPDLVIKIPAKYSTCLYVSSNPNSNATPDMEIPYSSFVAQDLWHALSREEMFSLHPF